MLCKGSPIFFSFLQGSLPSLWASLFSGYLSMKKSDSTVLFFCRCYVISHLPSLVMLDDHAITGEEREEARKVYGNRRVSGSSRRASKKHKEKVCRLKTTCGGMIWAGYYSLQSGRSQSGADLGGECRAYANPPEMTCSFLIQLVFCIKTYLCHQSVAPFLSGATLLRTILDTPLIVITECRGFSLICFANGQTTIWLT